MTMCAYTVDVCGNHTEAPSLTEIAPFGSCGDWASCFIGGSMSLAVPFLVLILAEDLPKYIAHGDTFVL